MSQNLIRDGYTRKGRINGEDRNYEQLDFEYRPMLSTEVNNLDSKIGSGSGGRDVRLIAGVLADKVVSWSEVDDNGDPEPITADAICKLPWPLLTILHKIVAGIIASDPIEDQDAQGEADEASIVQSILEGNDSTERTDRKN